MRLLSSATTPGQSGPGSNVNKGVLRIPQNPALLEPYHQIYSIICGTYAVGSYATAEKGGHFLSFYFQIEIMSYNIVYNLAQLTI